MKTRLAGLISVCAGVLSLHAQTLRTAGTLAVDVTADTITAADGDAVTSWGVCVRKVTSFRRSCRKDCLSDGGLTVAAPLPIVVVEPDRDERPDPQDVQSAVR